MKSLNGQELVGFIKERQAHMVRELKSQKIFPKLVIIRDSDNPVITKYVNLKKRYGEDIGVIVEDVFAKDLEEVKTTIKSANTNKNVSGMIVQLPLKDPAKTDEIVALIDPAKDVDNLSGKSNFDAATATAINWLLTGYGVELKDKKIAVVGRGRLVGQPLIKMWQDSHFDVTAFHYDSDFNLLKDFDIIVTATGNPHLIQSNMIKSGVVIVDAGTASEGGMLVGDISNEIRERKDLAAITPKVGGVGPLTVGVLFDNVIRASK